MKESIVSRVSRIISGSIHQLIDAFENMTPEAVMTDAIREIDSVMEEVRAALGKKIANRHMASKRLSEANAQHRDLTAKIELAIKEKREDLAEAAIARQLDIEAQKPVLESAIRELDEKSKELEGFITALQAKKREMKEELRQFQETRTQAALSASETDGVDNSAIGFQSRIARAESAFDRVLEKQTGLPGTGADLKISGQLMELEELSRNNRIQERLAAAKAKIGIEK